MKTREFNIENYKTADIIYKMVTKSIDEQIKDISHPFIKEGTGKIVYPNFWKSNLIDFDNLPKATQKEVIKEAKAQYEVKKKETMKKYKEIKEKCDAVFYDDKMYLKLVPELDNLFYCQAYSALSDFMDKKQRSKAVSNSRFQARLMSYSKVACD